MDATNHKAIKKMTEKETDWTDRINENVEVGSINEEKEMLIERYENVLNFLKRVQMNNVEDLVHIKKPLDDLESNLKYIPNGPFFNDVMPTEIMENILGLSYSCDSKAFIAASVCQQWKGVLENRLKGEKVFIGEKCSKCEDNMCVKTTDMLKAAVAHKLDVHLVIYKPIPEVGPKLITEALTNVSKFTVTNHFEYEYDHGVQILSTGQFDHLFESIERGNKIMANVNLIQLDLNGLDQEILANCLVNKIKRLTLDQKCFGVRMLDVEKFLSKLLQDSNHLKLTHLTLIDFSFHKDFESKPDLSSSFVVSALCHVENLKFCGYTNVPMEPLLENLLQTTRSNEQTIKTLIIDIEDYVKRFDIYLDYLDYFNQCLYDFGSLINPQDLKTLFSEMSTLQLEGVFTLEQQEAVSSLPDVEVGQIQFGDSNEVFQYMKKGSPEMF